MSDFFVKASATAHTYFKGLHGMTVFARFPKAVVIYSRGKGISRGVKKCTSYFYLKTACYTKKYRAPAVEDKYLNCYNRKYI